MEHQRHCTQALPDDYVLIKCVDAKRDKKVITIYTLLSFVPLLIGLPLLAFVTYQVCGYNILHEGFRLVWTLLVAYVILMVYLVLHELTHGITYKIFTGGKLTYGFTLAVAFCGVPQLYVRRRASLAALLMPFVVFTIIFTALTVGMYFVHPLYGIVAGAVLCLHIGGCVGDLHWVLMYLTIYRGCDTLMRDTGPTQYLYVSATQAAARGFKVIDIPHPDNNTDADKKI